MDVAANSCSARSGWTTSLPPVGMTNARELEVPAGTQRRLTIIISTRAESNSACDYGGAICPTLLNYHVNLFI